MRVQHVVDILAITSNDLPSIEERFKRLRNDVSMLQSQKCTRERRLYQLNNQIAITTKLLNSFRVSCERERRKIEDLYNEKAILEVIVTEFKSNNEEYLKIRQAAEENVKSDLTNGKLLLNFPIASIMESLRMNPELCNFVFYDISNNNTAASYGSNYLSLKSGEQEQQSFDDIYSALILEEAEKIYSKLTTKLTNDIITASCVYPSIVSLSCADIDRKEKNYLRRLEYTLRKL